jgi:hypothetical protein
MRRRPKENVYPLTTSLDLVVIPTMSVPIQTVLKRWLARVQGERTKAAFAQDLHVSPQLLSQIHSTATTQGVSPKVVDAAIRLSGRSTSYVLGQLALIAQEIEDEEADKDRARGIRPMPGGRGTSLVREDVAEEMDRQRAREKPAPSEPPTTRRPR